MKFDSIVLGAGMVGVSTALHLLKSGQSVALIDRRPAAEETSYGNAGIIQSEAYIPYTFPRDVNKIIDVALNRSTEAHLHWRALPTIAPWLLQYWCYGSKDKILRTATANVPLISRCLAEHEALMKEAGIADMLRYDGYLRLYRNEATLQAGIKAEQETHERFGSSFRHVSPAELSELEPHLSNAFAGAIHFTDPASINDPEAVGKAYAKLFQSLGGTFLTGDACTLEAADGGWQIQNVNGPLHAHNCVIALGPWSGVLLKMLGVHVPLQVKRGYHMHYSTKGNATLTRPVLDSDHGFVMAPMRKGIRLTTGAEFASIDAMATPVQIDRIEPAARDMFPLSERVDAKIWLGQRPSLPDMLPMIGGVPGHPGLWANFGHHHLGLTLGPATGRLLAEIITQQPTFCDIHPYRVDRF
ncbi:MAG: FAD-dependent oxidoreductase [Pseudomonadota bacterium]